MIFSRPSCTRRVLQSLQELYLSKAIDAYPEPSGAVCGGVTLKAIFCLLPSRLPELQASGQTKCHPPVEGRRAVRWRSAWLLSFTASTAMSYALTLGLAKQVKQLPILKFHFVNSTDDQPILPKPSGTVVVITGRFTLLVLAVLGCVGQARLWLHCSSNTPRYPSHEA